MVIKEYFPSDLSLRNNGDNTVIAKSSAEKEYHFGLDKFLEEGRVLAQFSHPNIVSINRYIEANNTAYLIMDYEEGEDLSNYLKRTGSNGNMPENELKRYLIPVLNGLAVVHDIGLLHRDIKPNNIYLRKNGEPMLIDFGAARYALMEQSKSISAIVAMGYAPPEQYSSKAKQSPASDLYAWGATAYQLITGKVPIESPERFHSIFETDEDPFIPFDSSHKNLYSPELLNIVKKCLNIKAKDRPQSANEVLKTLTPEAFREKTQKVKPDERFEEKSYKQRLIFIIAPLLLILLGGYWKLTNLEKSKPYHRNIVTISESDFYNGIINGDQYNRGSFRSVENCIKSGGSERNSYRIYKILDFDLDGIDEVLAGFEGFPCNDNYSPYTEDCMFEYKLDTSEFVTTACLSRQFLINKIDSADSIEIEDYTKNEICKYGYTNESFVKKHCIKTEN
ncbi:MAG: serine/threonine-protein kinase [Marinicella sp.]